MKFTVHPPTRVPAKLAAQKVDAERIFAEGRPAKNEQFVDWPTLREWCLAHGAKNDLITAIRIDGGADSMFTVIIEGHELDDGGKPFLSSRDSVATWQSSQRLRSLPGGQG